jgi:hypothetical protein
MALFDELGLQRYGSAALPLEEVRPSLPWKTIDEVYTRRRDVDAYEVRKDKATNVAATWWPRMPLDFSRQELAFLDSWLQEKLHRDPGSSHGEQASRGVWDRQLMNLVWASNLEIEPREATAASWPWHSQEEFCERLRSAATRLYERAWFRPKPATPFRPEENRFMVAWIQEGSKVQCGNYSEDARPIFTLIKSHAPEMASGSDPNVTGLDRSAWWNLRKLELAWLKVKGLHELAVEGGPPAEGLIVYPWKDRAEFETRVRDAERIIKRT